MNNENQIVIYQNHQGGVQLDVRLNDETVWLTKTQMSTLFGKAVSSTLKIFTLKTSCQKKVL